MCLNGPRIVIVKIRIKSTPVEEEIDGVKLGVLVPGTVRNVSSVLGLWLIAQGYAQPEMRADAGEPGSSPLRPPRSSCNDQQRRYTDRPKKRS